MFAMAGDAPQRVDVPQGVCIAGIREFAARMWVKGFLTVFGVAVEAGFVYKLTVRQRVGMTQALQATPIW